MWIFFLIGFDGSVDPVNELGDSSVDARFHGIGASQTPGRDALQDVFVLGVAHQRATTVTLQGEENMFRVPFDGNWTCSRSLKILRL